MQRPTHFHRTVATIKWIATISWVVGFSHILAHAQQTPVASPPPVSVASLESRNAAERFSFKAVDLEIKQALALFAESNGLNIIPNQDIQGSVTVSFTDLPLDLAMEALLDAHGYYFTKDNDLIRVRNFQTRIFNIDYINTVRTGAGSNDVQFSSRGGTDQQGSSMSVSANSTIDFWQTVRDQLESMVSPEGSYTVNSLAGVVSVTERYARMGQIASVLERVSKSVVRQVELEVEIYEVSISESEQLGIDWDVVSNSLASEFSGRLTVPSSAVSSGFEGNTLVIEHSPNDNRFIIEALQQQGDLKVLSKPKLRTLNNQPAVIRVGQDLPVFRQTVTQAPGDPPLISIEEEIVNITIGTVLSITPQISLDGMITLDVSPAVSRLIRNEISAVTGASAPVIDVRQASSIVRVQSGSTVILGGLVQTQDNSVIRKIPFFGDIPLVGKAFRGHRETTVNNELVIILRPTITE